jgi:hypothetical protein
MRGSKRTSVWRRSLLSPPRCRFGVQALLLDFPDEHEHDEHKGADGASPRTVAGAAAAAAAGVLRPSAESIIAAAQPVRLHDALPPASASVGAALTRGNAAEAAQALGAMSAGAGGARPSAAHIRVSSKPHAELAAAASAASVAAEQQAASHDAAHPFQPQAAEQLQQRAARASSMQVELHVPDVDGHASAHPLPAQHEGDGVREGAAAHAAHAHAHVDVAIDVHAHAYVSVGLGAAADVAAHQEHEALLSASATESDALAHPHAHAHAHAHAEVTADATGTSSAGNSASDALAHPDGGAAQAAAIAADSDAGAGAGVTYVGLVAADARRGGLASTPTLHRTSAHGLIGAAERAAGTSSPSEDAG